MTASQPLRQSDIVDYRAAYFAAKKYINILGLVNIFLIINSKKIGKGKCDQIVNNKTLYFRLRLYDLLNYACSLFCSDQLKLKFYFCDEARPDLQAKFTLVLRTGLKFWNLEFLPREFGTFDGTGVLVRVIMVYKSAFTFSASPLGPKLPKCGPKFENLEFLPALRNFSQEKFSQFNLIQNFSQLSEISPRRNSLNLTLNRISPSSQEFMPGEF